MKSPRLTPAALKSAGIGAFFRPRDLEALDVRFEEIQRLVKEGTVEKMGAGLYRVTSIAPNEFETLAMVSSLVPKGTICLLSALRLHSIGTQSPHKVWLAIDRKARKPKRLPAQVRIVRFSGPMLSYGIETRSILGVPVRVTSPARTIVDCFRYRSKLGIDVALEALREAVRARAVKVEEIMRAAEVCRARTVMKTYLEALSP